MAFVVPPTPKSERIPVITVEELANALRAYLPTVYEFSYIGEYMDSSNVDKDTTLVFHGNSTKGRVVLEAVISGKAARSEQAKLYNIPFTVSIHEKHDDTAALIKMGQKRMSEILASRTRYLLITPLADRSISIQHILRWENGKPVLAD